MSTQQYDSTRMASIYNEVRPIPTKDLVKSIINQLAKSVNPKPNGKWSTAIDVGCGSGQATFLLADHFDQVIGYDISEPQLEIANQLNRFTNVSFKVSSGEDIPLDDNSVDLITVCEALHFFDIEKFNRKVDSLLVPGGLFVVISYYQVPRIRLADDSNSSFIDSVVEIIERTRKLWQDHGFPVKIYADQIQAKYRCIDLPFEKVCHEESFEVTLRRPASYIIDLLNSHGVSEKFMEKYPEKHEAHMKETINQLNQIFGTKDLSSIQIDVVFDFFIICFKK